MLHLLKVEWMKVKNYRTFWILSALYLVSIFGVNYLAFRMYNLKPKQMDMANAIIGDPPFKFPEVWHTISYFSSFLMFLPGLLMIISVTNEYSFKTHRQNIIDGWSRREFIIVKMLLAVIIAAVSTAAVFITAIGFGLYEGSTVSLEKMEYIGYFFIQALSYSSIALLFTILFRRSGLSIGFYFLYSLILENILAGVLNHYADNIGRYLPLETTDNLIRVPVFKVIVNQVLASYNVSALLTMSIVYLGLYYFITLRKFETDDL
jgi:hypothetical protein